MNLKKLILIFYCMIMAGCGVQDNILEDVLLAEVTGYDYAGKDKIRGSTVVAVSQSGENSKMGKEVYSATTHTGRNFIQKVESQAPRRLVGGRLAAVLYGETLAKKGIYDFVDTYRRDPSIGRDLYLAVVAGKAEDIVKIESKMLKTPGVKTKELIEQNIQTNLPEVNLHNFLNYYYGDNMDPVMPLLEVKHDHMRIKGIALFRDDKYTGKYITYQDGFIFKVLFGSFNNGLFEIRMKEDSYITAQNITSKVKYEIKDANGSPKVFISIEIRGGLLEVHEVDLRNPEAIPTIENKAKKVIEEKARRMVKMFQKINVDPLRMGDLARSQTRHFNRDKWDHIYPTIPVNIHVDVKLVQEGITE
jgi:spore germination protein